MLQKKGKPFFEFKEKYSVFMKFETGRLSEIQKNK